MEKINHYKVEIIIGLIVQAIVWVSSKIFGILPSSVLVPIWVLSVPIIFVILGFFIVFKARSKKMKDQVKKEFGTQKVILDGKRFTECKFNHTELVYRGEKPFELNRCEFNNPRLTFSGCAGNALQALNDFYKDVAFKETIDKTLNNVKMDNST